MKEYSKSKFIVVFLFVLVVGIMLLAYERPKKSKKITGLGGDFSF
jgi:hypothetical protein